ncbi:MAG: hypothetical protein ACRDCC_08375 [Culicoidibacterales bacterium]
MKIINYNKLEAILPSEVYLGLENEVNDFWFGEGIDSVLLESFESIKEKEDYYPYRAEVFKIEDSTIGGYFLMTNEDSTANWHWFEEKAEALQTLDLLTCIRSEELSLTNQRSITYVAKERRRFVESQLLTGVELNLPTIDTIADTILAEPKEVIEQLAENPNTPYQILHSIVNDEKQRYSYLNKIIVQNPNTHMATLDELSDYEDIDIRKSIIKHPNTSNITLSSMAAREVTEDVLLTLLSYSNSNIRHSAIHNENIKQMPKALTVIEKQIQTLDSNFPIAEQKNNISTDKTDTDIMDFCGVDQSDVTKIFTNAKMK